ncbi:MAG: glycoside hydrolase family 43 protein, partial [Bacteroidota bacterium]
MKRNAICCAVLFVLASIGVQEHSFGQSLPSFTNPVIAGFYPDPSICRVGKDYYIVNSTFSYFPGINVFHSRDLVHWKLIGYVLNMPEQFNLDGQGVSRGLFAPAIRYHNGLFYVTCTLVDIGGNFVATAKDPAGPWSNPVWLPEINGIDPSLFFDNDGKAYIVYNSIPPDDKPLYNGHRTIRIHEFDPESLKVKGEERILINGGTDINKKPAWIEGPHIFKKDGVYYLIDAEGGTADQHSEVVFKSTNVYGPYVSYENNPILTQRQLDPQRPFPITSTGHADFVQTESGDWWAVFLGCRPYEDEYYNTGRETFLAPVRWKDGWPTINPGHEEVQYYYPYPIQSSTDSAEIPTSGNFRTRDEFDSPELNLNWVFLRTPHEKWFDLTRKKGFLSMKVRPETCVDSMNPSFLSRRQQHLSCSATTALLFTPKADNEKAGLLVFQNEKHFYFLCKSSEQGKPVIQFYQSDSSGKSTSGMELIASVPIGKAEEESEVLLRIEAKKDIYSFSFAYIPGRWIALKDSVDARFLSTRVAGGFVGCMYAMYATSQKKESNSI